MDDGVQGGGFGALLRLRRLEAGLTQEELAEGSGVSVRAIADLERGRSVRPQRRTVVLLAGALGLAGPALEEFAEVARGRRARARRGPGWEPAEAGGSAGPGAGVVLVPRQLPAAAAHFAGRAGELAALDGLLAEAAGGAMVVSAVAGTAGVGKTALAVQWAHRAAGRFPDGQLYVNLRGYDAGLPVAAGEAVAGFLRALGVPGQDIPADAQERAARYRTLLAGRRVLVVLDNARSADQVRPLLPGSPGCVALVTSRDALAGLVARDGARRLDLDLLPMGEAVGLVRALVGARAAADPAAVQALAALCSRLPLALRVMAEVAVARPQISLAELAGELADLRRRLDVLEVPGDQGTAVRSVFSWSYQQLEPAAARAFRLLGLHPGTDFDGHAAAALAGAAPAEAARLVGLLARAHLIQPLRQGRHGMHDLLRAYAAEQAAGGHDGEAERRAALGRLLDHYLHTAAAAMDTLYPAERGRRPEPPRPAGPPVPVAEPAAASAWLETELAALTAVTTYAADHLWPTHAHRLATTLFRHLQVSGRFVEINVMFGSVCRAARRTGDRAAEAQALNSFAAVDYCQGRLRPAASHWRQALAVYRQSGDQAGEARMLGNLGSVDSILGRYPQAIGNLQGALVLFRLTGDRVGESRTLTNVAMLEMVQGRHQAASVQLQEALVIAEDTADHLGSIEALINLGHIQHRTGCCEAAAGHHRQALALSRTIGYRTGEAGALSGCGEVDLALGHPQLAGERQRQALAVIQQVGDPGVEATIRNRLGEALLAAGEAQHAREQHGTALRLARQIGDKYEEARARNGLGKAEHATGDQREGQRHRQQALRLFTALGAAEAGQLRAALVTAAAAPAAAATAPGTSRPRGARCPDR